MSSAVGQIVDPQRLLVRRVVSYNVENLFDIEDDPATDDKEFLPDGSYRWTENRYRRKVRNISSTLSRLGEWGYPALIGLVEVENVKVVRDLVYSEALRKEDYRMSVSRGADPRGIDVALLWDPKLFRRVDAREIPHYGDLLSYPLRRDPRNKVERSGTGRNTLWVTLEQRHSGALLDCFVLHLPSRRGGVRSTSADRVRICEKLRRVIDDLLEQRPDARILIMGDFNDDPDSPSIIRGLQAKPVGEEPPQDHVLYNLASAASMGSHYFDRHYWLPDQIIVSGALLRSGSPIYVRERTMEVFTPTFLKDRRQRPRRTYQGLYYAGGYSDHYPVYIELVIDPTPKAASDGE